MTDSRARRRGMTLVELLIALAIVSVGVVACMASFRVIAQSLTGTRRRTAAVNLAREKVEQLRAKPYYLLLVTTQTALSAGYAPNFSYDDANYPPETLTLPGLPPMTRAVEVDYASVSGTSVSTVSYAAADTGMKRVTVYVLWKEGTAAKKVRVDTYYSNPAVAALSTGFKGSVTDAASGLPVAGALVQVVGEPRWRALTDASGGYFFQVSPGSYTLSCSSNGYFGRTAGPLGALEGFNTTWSPALPRKNTGMVTAAAVYTPDPGLVISQVVASTVVPNGYDVQYVELYNPTTAPVDIGSGASHQVRLAFASDYPGPAQSCPDLALVYVTTYAAAGGYYLVANTSSFTLGGVSIAADAYFSDAANTGCSNPSPAGYAWSPPAARPILFYGESGVLTLSDASGSALDAVGWARGADVPSGCAGSCVPLPAGLLRGDGLVRFSSACASDPAYGRGYDSGSNAVDFLYNPAAAPAGLALSPSDAASAHPVLASGRPASSAFVMADDGSSAAASAGAGTVSGPQGQACPVSSFTLVGVATGTWKVVVASGAWSAVVSGVTVASGAVVGVPNAATSPPWPAAGANVVLATVPYAGGYVSGRVFGAGSAYYAPLSGILVGAGSGGGVTTRTDAQGFYMLSVPTGPVTVYANLGADNAGYLTDSVDGTAAAGALVSLPDFHLSQGGTIRGYVTAGAGPLPNVSVQATQGGAVYSDASDATGYFAILVATAATPYTVTPDLDPMESYAAAPASPLVSTVTAPGSTVFAGTFTVFGAMGAIAGTARLSGSPIATGVLVVASTAAVPDPFPAVVASSAPAQAIYYSASTRADGTYSLDVRSSTTSTYNVRGYYPVVDSKLGTVSWTSKLLTGVSVSAGGTASGRDLSWP